MRRVLIVLVLALVAGRVADVTTTGSSANAPVTGLAQARSPLEGVWKVLELWSRAPGGEWVAAPPPYLSLYIFTPGYYSYMFSPGAGPRQLFARGPNEPSIAEKVAAYDSVVAASGTYVLEGTNLTMRAVLHKNPSEMVGESLRYRAEFEGDRLRLTIANPPFAPGRERRTLLTRIE